MVTTERKSLLVSIILLPGTVTILVPACLLYVTSIFLGQPTDLSENIALLVVSLFFVAFGVVLAGMTMRLFLKIGHGTPAPWNPPKKLVIAGPYQYVRNPMITGIVCILVGEALMFWSVVLFLWVIFFLFVNILYFPLVEEKQLLKRYGSEYEEYARHVPRWIPRLTPWDKTS